MATKAIHSGRALLLLSLLLIGSCSETTEKLPPISSIPSDLRPYVQGLQDKNQDMRWQAARELGLLGVEAAPAVPYLAAALRDEQEKVRIFAALALGEIGPSAKEAVPDMEQVVETFSRKEFELAAKRSLTRIRGY